MGVATVRQAELTDGVPSMTEVNDAIRRTLEAGVEFLDEARHHKRVALAELRQHAAQ